LQVALREHVLAEHPAGVADVELRGPVPCPGELVGGESEAAQLPPDRLRECRVGCQEEQQALRPPQVLRGDLFSAVGARVGVVPAGSEEVRRHRTAAVDVDLAVQRPADPHEVPQIGGCTERGEVAADEDIALRVVRDRFRKRETLLRILGQADPIAVGLHLAVTVAQRPDPLVRLDVRQQAAVVSHR
jgi:hypothetical protein